MGVDAVSGVNGRANVYIIPCEPRGLLCDTTR